VTIPILICRVPSGPEIAPKFHPGLIRVVRCVEDAREPAYGSIWPKRLARVFFLDSWGRATPETESTQGLLTMWRAAVLAVRIERERLRQREPGRIGPGYLNRTKDAEKVEPRWVNVSSGAPDPGRVDNFEIAKRSRSLRLCEAFGSTLGR
jgi:hypothetical protein